MPTKPLKRSDVLPVVQEVQKFIARGYVFQPSNKKGLPRNEKSAVSMAATALGIPRETAFSHIKIAKERWGITPENYVAEPDVISDEYKDRSDPLDLVARAIQQNAKYIARKRLKPAGFMVRPEPFGVAIMGDPHLSNIGCNMAALKDDVDLLRATQTRTIQLGDLLDNFWAAGPKLAAKEADNHMTRDEALSLAEWFVADTGLRFDGMILGNHDLWLGPTGVNLMAGWVAKAKSRLFDWNGRFIYNWGSGQYIIDAAHDHKGHSQFNPLHGQVKKAIWDGTADAYISGHRHNNADMTVPNGFREKTYLLARARGYKDRDSYSEGRPQFAPLDFTEGRSILISINPLSETQSGRARAWHDLSEGIEYVEFLKRRHAA